MKFSEFIWDFDGTLFNTYPVMVRAFQETLRRFGIIEGQRIIVDRMKQTVNNTIRFYQSQYHLGEEFINKYLAIRQSYSFKEQPPFSGANHTCQKIVAQGGRNFIISHRDEASLIALLEYYKMRQYFTEIVTSEFGFERKPNPEAFHYLLTKHQIPKEKALAIGDRLIDIIAARTSGIATVYFCPDDDSQFEFADYRIRSLEEILNLSVSMADHRSK